MGKENEKSSRFKFFEGRKSLCPKTVSYNYTNKMIKGLDPR